MKRFIRYLYEYEQGRRLRNVGFVKVEQGEEECTLNIHGKGLHMKGGRKLALYLFYEEDGGCVGIWQGTVDNGNPAMSYRLYFTKEDVAGPEEFRKINGIILEDEMGHKYAAVWNDAAVNVGHMRVLKPQDVREEAAREEKPVQGREPVREEVPGQGREPVREEAPEQGREPEREEAPAYGKESVHGEAPAPAQGERKQRGEEPGAVGNILRAAGRNGDTSDTGIWRDMRDMPQTGADIEASQEPAGESEENLRGEPEENLSKGSEENLRGGSEENLRGGPEENLRGGLEENLRGGPEENLREQPEENAGVAPEEVRNCVRCMKIQRNDLARLPRCEWKWANNSFLLHGYSNYHHLALIDDGEKFRLGVPGIYHPQEAKAASAFGFMEFIPFQNIDIELTDEEKSSQEQFGYWCRHVKRMLKM